jgi:putative transposase
LGAKNPLSAPLGVMPRKPRHEEAGAVHHVFARGVERRDIFLTTYDREAYLGLLGFAVVECGWNCLAYCLMTNHVHLLIETPEPNLARGIHRAHGMYAQGFNERYGRVGHLFQDRYRSSRVRTEARLVQLIDYLALNPVEAGLCEEPTAWPWSSTGAPAAGRQPVWLAADRAAALVAEFGRVDTLPVCA